jgi:FkbM family methyltransferase
MLADMIAERLVEIVRKASKETSRINLFESLPDWVRWFRLRTSASVLSGETRTPGEALSVRFRDAMPLLMRLGTTDCRVAQEILIDGEYEFISKLELPPRPNVIDLGANIGVFLHFVAQRWPLARLLAVEPDLGNFAMLERNARAIHDGVVSKTVRACVGGERGFTQLSPNWGEWAITMGEVSDKGDVPVLTMADLCRDHGIERIDLLKCDIEGAERQVFADCSEWIQRVQNLVVEVHEPYRLADLQGDLERNGRPFDVLGQSRGKSTYLLRPRFSN